MSEIERAREYLDKVSPDVEREVWVKCLMALKNSLGDDGEYIARAWSSLSDKYRAQDFKDTWRSLNYDGPVTLGSLAHLAGHTPKTQQSAKRSTFDYAKRLWDESNSDSWNVLNHPYAQKKEFDELGGTAWCARGTASGKIIGRNADCLIVPMRDWQGELTGVECINREGKKQTFGQKGLLIIGDTGPPRATFDYENDVHICEGFATGLAINRMFPGPTVVAFGKSRLEQVALEQNQRGGIVFIHEDDEDGTDAWDYWASHKGSEYRRRLARG